MKELFNFSRGEIIATILLIAIIVCTFLIDLLGNRHKQEAFDMATFKIEASHFLDNQQRLADSAAEARLQSQNHKKTYSQDGSNYYEENNRNSNYFIQDTGIKVTKIYYEIVKLNINLCDTSEIQTIPQFGVKRSQKLVEFREKLGGFYSLSQLQEVFVLQNVNIEHLEKYFFVNSKDIRKLEINKASYAELISHPYFDVYLAKTILHYREKEGKIGSMDQFKMITHAYPELIEKLNAYLSFE